MSEKEPKPSLKATPEQLAEAIERIVAFQPIDRMIKGNVFEMYMELSDPTIPTPVDISREIALEELNKSKKD